MNKNDKHSTQWWRGAFFYQIYPRSFCDTTGSGTGDLRGITDRLDYVATLGVEGIWISPFFKSPMKDFGYDVSNYRDVDPLFGSLEDFKALIEKAHGLGLKIIVDLVMNHTSNKHPWFKESRSSLNNDKADWYVWADPKPDGTAPNNWLSVFGGPAWTFDTKRGQYYLHNFLKEQPDLNFHNPDMRAAMLDTAKYWLDFGVDGFRLDVINFCFCDKNLRNNPPRETSGYNATQLDFKDPYGMQQHIFDKSRPENLAFIKELRMLCDHYDNRFLLGEIGDDEATKLAAEYTAGTDRLHTTYSFALMHGRSKELTSTLIRDSIEEQLKYAPDGWPSWAFSNHDVVRSLTRFGGKNAPPELAKMLLALLGCLRGSAFLYQGEELGLTEAQIPYEKIQDPWGKALWPEWQGRDGCRTPMPWSTKIPEQEGWLPIPKEHLALSVQAQNIDPNSTLAFTQKFLHWRKSQAALINGSIEFQDTDDEKLLAFTRSHEGKTLLCLFNFSNEEKSFKDQIEKVEMLYSSESEKSTTISPYGFIIGKL